MSEAEGWIVLFHRERWNRFCDAWQAVGMAAEIYKWSQYRCEHLDMHCVSCEASTALDYLPAATEGE